MGKKKWEYMSFDYTVRSVRHVESADTELNQKISSMLVFEALNYVGARGWELVSAVPNEGDPYKYGMLFFKRQIE